MYITPISYVGHIRSMSYDPIKKQSSSGSLALGSLAVALMGQTSPTRRLLVHEPVQHGAFFSDAHVNHIPPMLCQPFIPQALVQETTFAMPILTA